MMNHYVVEVYAPAGVAGHAASVARARSAARAMTAEGRPISHRRAILLPADDTCFHVFQALTADDAAEASRRAGLSAVRVTEAVE